MSVDKDRLRQKLRSLSNLPPLPAVIQKISQMVEKPSTTAADLSEVISKDQSLATKVLRLVNSPIYGFPGKISSISHAVVLLGFNVVKGLVLGTFVSGLMSKAIEGLWEHSLGCSLAAGIIARKVDSPSPEEASVAGLLHDVGKAAIKITMPEDFKRIMSLTKEKDCYIIEAEKDVLDKWSHTNVGNELAVKWNLPINLRDPLVYHHDPAHARSSPQATAIIHLADVLIKSIGFGFSGDKYVPPLNKRAWESLGLSFSELEEAIILLRSDVERVGLMFE